MIKDAYLRNDIHWEIIKKISSDSVDCKYLLLSKIDGYYYYYYIYLNNRRRLFYTCIERH